MDAWHSSDRMISDPKSTTESLMYKTSELVLNKNMPEYLGRESGEKLIKMPAL
jgi:hypothetical protein